MITAHFQGSGRLDVASAFTVFEAHGDGSFAAGQSFGQYFAGGHGNELPGGISWVAAGDFNGDGKADLAGPDATGRQLSVLLSNTTGSDASAYALSAADYSPIVAPGSMVSVFGSGFAAAPASAGVRILDANGVERSGELLYVSPAQINLIVPPDTAPGYAIFNVTSDPVSADGSRSTLVDPIAPTVFTLDETGQGPPAATAVRVFADGSQVPVPVSQCSAAGICSLVPIDLTVPGTVYISLYGTGFRQATGAACDAASTDLRPTYVGPQPTVPGLDQMNLQLPSSLPSGMLKAACQISGVDSTGVISVGYINFMLAIDKH